MEDKSWSCGLLLGYVDKHPFRQYPSSIQRKVKQRRYIYVYTGSKKYIRIDKFLFKYISNPNYFGEIIEWTGYAIASGHFYAWLFVFSTINVLTPAAMVRSKWNK